MTQVMACIDGSAVSAAVCDCAAWASARLGAPLTLLHVLDQREYPAAAADFSGILGLGSRELLLHELATLDEQRNRLALEQGRLMLEAARARVLAAGFAHPQLRQRHGDLPQSLHELEGETRLLVIGRQGESAPQQQVGSQLESVIRLLHRPILVVPPHFAAPRSALFAFDGSATARKGLDLLAASPLLRGLPLHLLMVGADTAEARAALDSAHASLAAAGFAVQAQVRAGEVEPTLHAYQAEHGIDLLVMGAYGHSRIRQFFIGSTTTALLRSSSTPLLLLR
ncbi:universal stress protein [Pseudomonas oligotrophica]|uniref:universal stress protein n=1 Tax=Pseudomonas oligotrophica TaxID=2912055 RepID=UPI001F1E9D0C|nr:universal stress protein [Pseudomonas oligotrophica]MCF7200538.1 universal stress protein [Pseudomonas oligotrophica]